MKHIRLFEQYNNTEAPAQLLVSGDWKGITKDGSPDGWIAPATFFFEYLPPGSPIPSGYDHPVYGIDVITDLETIAEESFTGDQNGINVAPKNYLSLQGDTSQMAEDVRNGLIRMFIDPSINVGELESYLEKYHKDMAEGEPDLWDEGEDLEPEYLRFVKEGKPFPRKIVFKK